MFPLLAGIGLKIAESAALKSATGFLSVIPKPVWEALTVLAYILALIALHQHYAHEAITQAVSAQKAADQKILDQTVANYRAAALKAQADDAANKARVEKQQSTISQQRDASYEARIADARARAERLQRELEAAAHSGSGGSPAVSGVSAPAGGPSSAAPEAGLPDALTATEQAIQLDELIKWVRQQHAIDPNTGAAK